jgi:SNF2 family DNA or RNA helicase
MRFYGNLKYKNKLWMIECEPHVALRLKRIFGKVDKSAHGTFKLSATPETSRDLEWFLQRYPLNVDSHAQQMMDSLSGEYKEKATILEKLLSGMTASQKFDMKLPARDYQTFAANMWLTAGGLLLADDVGLGKTAVGIAGLTDSRLLPTLVVVPSHMQIQWAEQIDKFVDGMTSHRLRTGTPYDLVKKGKFPDVVISTYHKLHGWADTLAPIMKSVIFDECQELRHDGSLKYKAAQHVASHVKWRLGLSATPIYNYGGEIFNVVNVLQPDVLGTREEFNREWCTHAYGKDSIKDPKAFGTYARDEGIMLRRTRQQVRRELPAITVVPHTIDTDVTVLERLEGKAIELAKTIMKQNQSFKGEKMQAAGEFDMRMRQATGISKAPFVAEFVKFLIENDNEKVILFGWHREVYEIWLERLAQFNPVMYTGSETPAQKEASKKAFIYGDSKVMMMSLRSGQGTDGLQDVAHVVVFGELDWSPGVHEQNIGRVWRDGQDEPVVVYYLVSEHGSDPIVQDVLGLKTQQITGLRDPNQDLVTKLQVVQADYIKKLAEKFLSDRGIDIPKENADENSATVVS